MPGTLQVKLLRIPQDKDHFGFYALSYFWQAILLPLIQSRGCKKNAYHMCVNSLYNKHRG